MNLINCGTVRLMEDKGKPLSPSAPDCGVPEPAFAPDGMGRVERQILDFLDGRTHGEELLHTLHDHVLDEPIPERMLALLAQAHRTEFEAG